MTASSAQDQKSTTLDDLVGGPYNEAASLQLLRMIAKAVVDLSEHPPNTAFGPPYPSMAQSALDRLCLLGAYKYPNAISHHGPGPRYPRSLPELLAWCRDRPICDWYFLELPEEFEETTDRLIETEPLQPSSLCLRLSWEVGPSTPLRDVEKRVMREVFDIYEKSGKEEGYLLFRRSLIDAPVMTSKEFSLHRMDVIGGVHLPDLPMKRLYTAVHDKYFDAAGKATVCAHCGLLLVPTGGSWVCEIGTCPSRGQVGMGAVLHRDNGDLCHVIRPIREFLVAPARINDHMRTSTHVPSPDRVL